MHPVRIASGEGAKGLFATKHFKMFDVIGEYCGVIRNDPNHGGEYVARFDEELYSGSFKNLSVDAGNLGNECRFINSYRNVAPCPNVALRTCMINRLPSLFVICTRAIAPGEEILMDYGDEYNMAYLQSTLASEKQQEHH